jgi:Ca-activated chloride channel family protein
MSTEMDYYGQTMNRLEAVKKVLANFIGGGENLGGRKGDLIGLVVFARYADTVCPLVLGHDVLLKFLEGTDIVKVRIEDGTAIGDAIALAAARLHKAEEEIQKRRKALGLAEGQIYEPAQGDFQIKSKVIILLTDGINNTGEYSPLQAAQMAKDWGIKIYTVGIGSEQAFATIQSLFGSYKIPTGQELDEELLKSIAEQTGGFYSRADDAESLSQIVKKIDESEKTEVKSIQYAQYSEKFGLWALMATVLLMIEMLTGCTLFRKVP